MVGLLVGAEVGLVVGDAVLVGLVVGDTVVVEEVTWLH
jgi:hypothetical protein